MGFIHPSVKLGPGVIVGDEVTIEEGCSIGPYSILEGDLHIGPDNRISSHVVLGVEPQDHKFCGGGRLVIGARNHIREYCSVHRGHLTAEGTVIGDDNDLLTGVHIGHDCKLGDHNFIANLTMLAGHVEVADDVNISGHVGFHQFCRVGSNVMISGMSAVRQDIPPYAMVQGDPAIVIGINTVGLKRAGWSSEQITQLREAYRFIRMKKDAPSGNVYYEELRAFCDSSDRGVIKMKRKG